MDLGFIFQILFNGLSLSASYAVMAVGLTLVFGVLRILNFAHGELLMVGAFVVWVLFAESDVPFFAAVVAAILFIGGLALGIERGLFRITRQNPFAGFIISLGLVYILQVSALALFGPLDKILPTAIPGQVEVLGTSFGTQRVVMVPVVAGVMALIWVLLEQTRFGRAVRACIQDSEAAALQGINFDRMSASVMFIAGALAGLGGVLISQTVPVGPYMGGFIILKAFVIVIVGGMGSVGGTVVAALMFGFLDSTVSTLLFPRLTSLLDVALMLIVLLVRPRGLFGRE